MNSSPPLDESALDQFDKTEWWDVARKMVPGLTEEEYDAMWNRFIEAKKRAQACCYGGHVTDDCKRGGICHK